MSDLLFGILTFLIAFPLILFIGIYLFHKFVLHKQNMASLGRTADVITFILFFSVPAAVYAFWETNILGYVIGGALLIGTIFTIVEWRTRKEVIVVPLLRKIWRSIFIVLNLLYIGAFIGGAIQSFMYYMS